MGRRREVFMSSIDVDGEGESEDNEGEGGESAREVHAEDLK